jgi:ADP-dependent NAD(P)H-hydrate dehydratase / NAD(P)H-hydrate epimerase
MAIPVISVAQMREWEKATWASGQTEEAVMGLAGQALARRAEQLTREGDLILVFAGKGHNGDDAQHASQYITGRELHLFRVFDPEATAKAMVPFLARHPALLIDGLFGIGLNRPLATAWTKLIQQINQSNRPILAVDVPSGLNADSGLPLDDAIRAAYTVTFGAVKEGLIKSNGWPFVGRLEVAPEIGLLPYPFTTEISMVAPEDFAGFPPPRPVAGHKGTFGHLAIIAGSLGYHGASVLAARGAQRAQPGLISLSTDPEVYLPVADQLQSVMVRPWSPEFPLPESCTAILFGPGLASPYLPESIKNFARHVWQESRLPVIADATGLDWLPAGPCAADALRVITPHPGEAARLLQVTAADVQDNRSRAVRDLSRRFGGCFVVLKGHQTMIGQSDEDLFVNCSGNPYLAQGGSGDLLAGYLGGLLAQPALQKEAYRTIRYAVWQHGAAADSLLATRPNWTVEELAEVLGVAAKAM